MKRSDEGSRARSPRARGARGEGALERYNEKRDFGVTAEPAGEIHATERGHAYAIQKHAATALHYDLRLELDGVLLSWAVPRGPSLSPKDKRLAVQTEDHPVDYREFEGSIPRGEYGGGPVIVWDRGWWEPIGDPREGMAKGRLELTIHGEKLRGGFILVRLAAKEKDRGKKNWLLIKLHDEHAREGSDANVVDALPRSVLTDRTIEDVASGVPAKAAGAARLPAFGATVAQLAVAVDAVPLGESWVYEIKYDGYRAIATLDEGAVRIATRSGKDWTARFGTIARALSHVRAKSAVFDGEIAYVMEDGRTDFEHLQGALGDGGSDARLVYFVFDLLYYDGVDLSGEPLAVRKDKLRTILAGQRPPLKLGDHMSGDGRELFAQICKMGLEGIIAKRIDKPHRAGRSPEWVKVKCQQRQELVIVGWTLPKGQRSGVGALILAVREGKTFRYAGKVGTGFTHATLDDLARRLPAFASETPTAEGIPKMPDARWARPELVCQVRFAAWTRDGVLRHPSFEGLREDKPPEDVVRERETKVAEATAAAHATATRHEGARAKAEEGTLIVCGVAISHPERVVDEEAGITKGDLARYAGVMAPLLLPFVKKRPLMLLRCTGAWDGVGALQGKKPKRASCFVQKHAGRGLVSGIGRGEVDGEEVIYVSEVEEIVSLVQLNAVELHGWGSRMPAYDEPDWIVLDLDPDVALPFARVVEAAIDLRDELAKMGLTTFVKTTGGKGLHVVVPLTPGDDWAVVGGFAAAVAHGMVTRQPAKYVATMTKAARTGKIFIDHFRNGRGATAILPYSPRARAGAPVAMPVSWAELATIAPRELTVLTAAAALEKRKVDPWADLLTTKQMIPRELAKALRTSA